ADRQGLAVAQAAIAAEVHQALDVEAHLAAQVAFDLVALFERLADAVDLVFGEVLGPLGGIELRRGTDLLRGGLADPIEVLQRRLDLLLAGKVYACNTRHLRISSALPLLVTGVRRADHAHHALAADHLALHADLLHRSTDLHGFLQPTKTLRKSLSFRPVPLTSGRGRRGQPGTQETRVFNSAAVRCQEALPRPQGSHGAAISGLRNGPRRPGSAIPKMIWADLNSGTTRTRPGGQLTRVTVPRTAPRSGGGPRLRLLRSDR